MTDREVAVRDPHAVAPAALSGTLIDIHRRLADVGDRGEHDGVEAEIVHPGLEVDAAGLLECAEALGEFGHRAPRIGARVCAHPRGIVGDVVLEARIAVGERALGLREDARAVDAGEGVKVGVAVRREEVLPRPRREVHDLAPQILARDEAAGCERGRVRAVALVVRHDREVDLDDLGARGFEVVASLCPQRDDARPRADASAGRSADADAVRRVVGVDVHPWDAEAQATHACLARERGIRRRSLGGGLRQRDPGLRTPEVAAGLCVGRDDHVEHFEQVGHRPRVRHDDVHRRHEGPVAARRDHTARGCVGAQGAVRGRAASARPRLLAEAERREARRSGGARAVRRP